VGYTKLSAPNPFLRDRFAYQSEYLLSALYSQDPDKDNNL